MIIIIARWKGKVSWNLRRLQERKRGKGKKPWNSSTREKKKELYQNPPPTNQWCIRKPQGQIKPSHTPKNKISHKSIQKVYKLDPSRPTPLFLSVGALEEIPGAAKHQFEPEFESERIPTRRGAEDGAQKKKVRNSDVAMASWPWSVHAPKCAWRRHPAFQRVDGNPRATRARKNHNMPQFLKLAHKLRILVKDPTLIYSLSI